MNDNTIRAITELRQATARLKLSTVRLKMGNTKGYETLEIIESQEEIVATQEEVAATQEEEAEKSTISEFISMFKNKRDSARRIEQTIREQLAGNKLPSPQSNNEGSREVKLIGLNKAIYVTRIAQDGMSKADIGEYAKTLTGIAGKLYKAKDLKNLAIHNAVSRLLNRVVIKEEELKEVVETLTTMGAVIKIEE